MQAPRASERANPQRIAGRGQVLEEAAGEATPAGFGGCVSQRSLRRRFRVCWQLSPALNRILAVVAAVLVGGVWAATQ